jgi:hypothetical protein
MPVAKLRCKYCKEYFNRETMVKYPSGRFCTKDHATEWAIENQVKGAKKIQKLERKETRQKKKELMTRSQWYSKLQKLVNQYITKVRDVGKPCCTCGTTNPDIKYDAGHCFTVGGRPDTRFDLSNIHIQCSQNCNVYGSGMVAEHKQFIIHNLGRSELDRLERIGKPLKEQFPNWQDIELEIVRYRTLLRDNNINPIV